MGICTALPTINVVLVGMKNGIFRNDLLFYRNILDFFFVLVLFFFFRFGFFFWFF